MHVRTSESCLHKLTGIYARTRTHTRTPAHTHAGTKVIATLGPATHEVEDMVKCMLAGASGARVDLTWGGLDYHKRSLDNWQVGGVEVGCVGGVLACRAAAGGGKWRGCATAANGGLSCLSLSGLNCAVQLQQHLELAERGGRGSPAAGARRRASGGAAAAAHPAMRCVAAAAIPRPAAALSHRPCLRLVHWPPPAAGLPTDQEAQLHGGGHPRAVDHGQAPGAWGGALAPSCCG